MKHITPPPQRIAPEFAACLGSLDLTECEREAGSVYGVFADERLGYYNPGWVAFAEANDAPTLPTAWPLGRRVTDAFDGPLAELYQIFWDEVRRSHQPWHFRYECSSAYEERHFLMITMPLEAGALLITNRLERTRSRRPFVPENPLEVAALYRNQDGIIHQCSYCRCTRRPGPNEQWDWVPILLDPTIPQVSHGICGICLDHYFPGAGARVQRES